MKTLPFLSPATIYLLVYDDITFPYPFSLIRFASLTGLVHCHAEPLVTYAPYMRPIGFIYLSRTVSRTQHFFLPYRPSDSSRYGSWVCLERDSSEEYFRDW